MGDKEIKSVSESNNKIVGSLRKNNLPWVDKYRPRTLERIIGHNKIREILMKSIKKDDGNSPNENLPHLLFYGMPGTGKTSTALALVNQLYGPDRILQKIMELNASDENGINVVREKIINFARINVGSGDPKYPSPPYKMIILDEADSMTGEAQTALKKVMESTCKITRFILICNYENKIIDPIKSRCSIFKFDPIPQNVMIERLREISIREGMEIGDETLKYITDVCKGDARQSIMTLQNMKYYPQNNTEIERINDIVSHIDEKYFDEFWEKCLSCDIVELYDQYTKITQTGYPLNNILNHISKKIIESEKPDNVKSKLCMYLANVERMITLGSENQLLSLLAYINGTYREIKIEQPFIF
jgi:replication factor C subunit 2/4